MKALLTGATGLIGSSLLPYLEAPGVLTRDTARAGRCLGAVEAHRWEAEAGLAPLSALRGVDVVYHLAGEPIAEGRWTMEKKRRIRMSRLLGTRHLVAALAQAEDRPKVLVTASAVGYYGDRGDEELDERSAKGDGFLAGVCADWEEEAMAATQLGIRVVCVRFGTVLVREGGALGRMLPFFQMGLGGRFGSGQQWMPWIHCQDAVGLLLHASRVEVRGPLNAVSPEPVRNAEFARALGRALRRPARLAVPEALLRIAFGETSEVLFASQRALPRAAEQSGYLFLYPQLAAALDSILRLPRRQAAG